MGEQSNFGLKSINDRLTNLEKNMSHTPIDDSDFLDKLKSATIQTSLIQQKNKITQIKDHFDKGLIKQVPEINMNMFTYIVEYTINYIESNINVIASVLDSKESSQLKLQTAITFVCEYFSNLDKEFIANSINHMVDIVFNRKKQVSSNINLEDDVPKNTKFGTLTKKIAKSLRKK